MKNFYSDLVDRVVERDSSLDWIESEIMYNFLMEAIDYSKDITVSEFIETYRQKCLEMESKSQFDLKLELLSHKGY